MKKVYEAPAVERVEFQYRDQVVVASGSCSVTYKVNEQGDCDPSLGTDKEFTSQYQG